MPLSEKKRMELKMLAERAEAILGEMEAEDEQEAPKRALTKKKRMGSKHPGYGRRQLRELEKENY